ncbi:MAG TPA: hypothetical protein VGD08_25245 [Stellaceae bacterium]
MAADAGRVRMVVWEIAFRIVDVDERAIEGKIEWFVGWCRGRGTEAEIVWRRDLGLDAGGLVQQLVAFELRSLSFRHPSFYRHWHRLLAAPRRPSRRELAEQGGTEKQ